MKTAFIYIDICEYPFWLIKCCMGKVATIKKFIVYEIDLYPEYVDIYQPVFSDNNSSINSWEPELYGKYVKVDITKLDNKNCSQTSSTTSTKQFGVTLQGGIKDKVSGTVNWGISKSEQISYQITSFGPIVQLGAAEFSYCYEYGGFSGYSYPSIVGFTGNAFYLHLYAPKIR